MFGKHGARLDTAAAMRGCSNLGRPGGGSDQRRRVPRVINWWSVKLLVPGACYRSHLDVMIAFCRPACINLHAIMSARTDIHVVYLAWRVDGARGGRGLPPCLSNSAADWLMGSPILPTSIAGSCWNNAK